MKTETEMLSTGLSRLASEWSAFASAPEEEHRDLYFRVTGFAAGAGVGAWQIAEQARQRAEECNRMATVAAKAEAAGKNAADEVAAHYGAFAGEISNQQVLARLRVVSE